MDKKEYTANQRLFNVLHELGIIPTQSDMKDIKQAIGEDEAMLEALENKPLNILQHIIAVLIAIEFLVVIVTALFAFGFAFVKYILTPMASLFGY